MWVRKYTNKDEEDTSIRGSVDFNTDWLGLTPSNRSDINRIDEFNI